MGCVRPRSTSAKPRKSLGLALGLVKAKQGRVVAIVATNKPLATQHLATSSYRERPRVRILAIESSDIGASVAVLHDPMSAGGSELLVEVPTAMRSARGIHPAIDKLLGEAAVEPSQIDVVAVSIGPGSFTGLRVGITAAKVFAWATGARVVAVDTLQVIARGVPVSSDPATILHVVLDAQRGDLFAGKFVVDSSGKLPQWKQLGETELLSGAVWLALLEKGQWVAGRGLTKIVKKLPEDVVLVEEQYWSPSALELGRLAWERAQHEAFDDVWALAPRYLRLSAAEEKRGAS